MEKVFFKDVEFKVTNKSVTYQKEIRDFSSIEALNVWDSDSIKNIKEVVGTYFSISRIMFYLILFSTFIFLGKYLNANELHLFGLSTVFSEVGLSIGIALMFTFVHYSFLKPMRYLSIKLKNGAEKKIQTPFDSLSVIEEAWNKAVDFGITPNDSFESSSLPHTIVSKDSFSIEEAVHRKYVSEMIMQSGKNSTWRTFSLSRIKKITDGIDNRSWFSEHGFAAMAFGILIVGGFFRYSPVIDFVSMGWFSIILVSIMLFVKEQAGLGERKITIELDSNEVLEINGHYNWGGESAIKKALNKAIHTA